MVYCVLSFPIYLIWPSVTSNKRAVSYCHEDVIKWKHFPRYWPFMRLIHRSPVNSPHNGQWRGALMFSLICLWLNGWVNGEAHDLKCHRAHYDVTVMFYCTNWTHSFVTLTITKSDYLTIIMLNAAVIPLSVATCCWIIGYGLSQLEQELNYTAWYIVNQWNGRRYLCQVLQVALATNIFSICFGYSVKIFNWGYGNMFPTGSFVRWCHH